MVYKAERAGQTRIDYLTDVVARTHGVDVATPEPSSTSRPRSGWVRVTVNTGEEDPWAWLYLRLPIDLAQVVIAAAAEQGKAPGSYLGALVADAHSDAVERQMELLSIPGHRGLGVPA